MNELSAQAEKVFLAVGDAAERVPKYPLTGFLPMKGILYDGALMVVGRAVNGWTYGIKAAELGNSDVARKYAAQVWKSVSVDGTEHTGCPMTWVSVGWGNVAPGQYNTHKSAFWRVIRRCVSGLEIADVENDAWPSHLVWSNLYKVSPVDGYNPAETLCRAQEAACIALLQAEIAFFQPRRLLFLTGGWAEPFWSGVASEVQQIDAEGIEAVGLINHSGGKRTIFVVAPHPMGKPETPIVEQVVAAFAQR